jgi:glyoxylase-like metal-dependent hydrolase (beta-lactamase superfamily II)
MPDISITGISRGNLRMDSNFARQADTVATRSEPNPDLEMIEVPIYNLVIDHPEATILWDTGAHPAAGEGYWPPGLFDTFPVTESTDHRLADDLDQGGYALADIDVVIQSHLHMDHAGGLHNFDGTEVPIYVHKDELTYAYLSARTRQGSNGYLTADFHHDLNWQVVTLNRATPFSGIEIIKLPGHTPGLMGLEISLNDQMLLFTSDLVEEHVNYATECPPGPGLVWNQEAWVKSLHRVKERAKRTDATVIYGHDQEQFDAILKGWG